MESATSGMERQARIRARAWLLPPLIAFGVIVVVLAVVAGAAAWMLRTEGGSRWLLSHTPYVRVEGLKGALMSERVAADRVRVEWNDGKASVTIDNVVGDGVHWTWRPAPSSWLGIGFRRLTASTITIDTGPPSTVPGSVPTTLTLPLQLNTDSAAADTLIIDGRTIVRRMSTGKVALSTNGEHRAANAEADWDRLRIRGSAHIGSLPPYAMGGTFEAQEADGSDGYTLALKGGGKLESIVLDLTVRSKPQPGREAPSADVHAVIEPWAAWWLAELNARTAALDLSAVHSAAPQTRLSGSAKIDTTAADAPVSATVQLDNALSGRWDEGRLPLRRLLLGVQGSTADRSRIVLKDFDVALGGTQDGGRWRGRGAWSRHELQLETTLDGVKPQFLDGRAAAMSLTGPLTANVSGLPSPDGARAAAPWSATIGARLEGRLDAAPLPVQLRLDLQTDSRRIELKELRAQSGAAVAQLQGTAVRGNGGGAGGWQLATAGSLAEFDPVPWWPGEAGSPWRQGPHKLNATWKLDVKLPAGRPTLPSLLQRTAGSGQLSVQESSLAGVPLALDLTLGQTPDAGTPPSRLHAALQLGGNRFELDARGDPAGSGAGDQAQLDVDAPTLGTLAPLLRLAPPLAAWLPKAGRLQGRANGAGRWPQLRTDGRLELAGLEAGALGIAQASASWRLAFDPDTQQPLEAQIDAGGVRWGRQKADKLTAQLRGTLADHQLQVAGAVPLGPPPFAEQMLGLKSGAGTRAQLAAQGRWQPDSGGGGRWQAQIARLAVGTWDGQAIGGDVAAGWIDARDLAAELQFDAEGRLVRVQAPSGKLRITDATLRWDAVDVDLRGAAANLALKAQLEPFAVAPLLARAQPSFGWKGDLRLGATLEIRAAERFDADIVFERRDGDLQITDEAGVQTLGLTDLRIALAAHDGTWFFTQAFAGRTLGEMAGALSVKTTPAERWPSKDAPVDGVLQAHVANLGVWGVWVPAGWRLAGELRTSATIGGRFGALQYTGQVTGERIGARNILLGVNLSQGDVAISLNGDSARIERFTLKGGDGTLTLTGGAEFTDKPVARLHGVAERFRLLGRLDRQLSTSGSADLTVSFDEVKLDGKFRVDDGLFDANRGDAPALDDDVTVRRAGDPERSADAAAAARPRRNVVVTVDVDLGHNLRIKGRGLDAELRGQLRITTPNGRLTVVGTVSTENGTYKAYGQNLLIDRGIVAFSGSVENPRLDILALRPNTDSRVGVLITGNLLTPRVRLYSDTDMSDTDRLSWLVLGRAPDGLGRTDTMLLQRAAVALLAGEGDAPTDQIMRTFGLDELSLKQSDTDVRETVISIGRQLSRRWYVGYERGVNATTGTFQLIYRIAQRFTLRAQSGQENSLDIIWSWRFDELPKPPGLKASAPP